MTEDAISSAIEGQKATIMPLVPFRATTKRFELRPGKYVILPLTQQPNPELKFLLRLFSEMPTQLTLVDPVNPADPMKSLDPSKAVDPIKSVPPVKSEDSVEYLEPAEIQ